MDFSDPQTWKDGFATVIGAPHIVFPFLALVAVAVWWLRGTIEQASKDALKGTIDTLKERLELAKEKEVDATKKMELANVEMRKLQEQGRAGTLTVEATAPATNAFNAANVAVKEVADVLRSTATFDGDDVFYTTTESGDKTIWFPTRPSRAKARSRKRR